MSAECVAAVTHAADLTAIENERVTVRPKTAGSNWAGPLPLNMWNMDKPSAWTMDGAPSMSIRHVLAQIRV